MVTASLTAAPMEAQAAPERPVVSHVWRDSAGEPLPFQTHEEILEFLRRAEVVDRSPIGRGVAGTERIVMERDGVRVRAAFRTIDETRRGPFEGLPRSLRRVRDAASFECAAYELSQALGLGRVPPTVWREVDGTAGSVQIWFEGGRTQDDYLEDSEPADLTRWNLQKRLLFVFDALIANLDRNQGNILVDRDETLWFIDHTRAFAMSRQLLEPEKVTHCTRDLWRALRSLDEAAMDERLEPYLHKAERKALFERREALVRHIEKLIAAEGVAAVLFEIDPPAEQTGTR